MFAGGQGIPEAEADADADAEADAVSITMSLSSELPPLPFFLSFFPMVVGGYFQDRFESVTQLGDRKTDPRSCVNELDWSHWTPVGLHDYMYRFETLFMAMTLLS